MPTVLRTGPYRVHFYSSDRGEPRHVHVQRDSAVVKVWLDPVRTGESVGFGRAELAAIERLIDENASALRKAWDDFFIS